MPTYTLKNTFHNTETEFTTPRQGNAVDIFLGLRFEAASIGDDVATRATRRLVARVTQELCPDSPNCDCMRHGGKWLK